MIAANFRKYPEALLKQQELSLVFEVKEEVTAEAMEIVRKTFAAGGEWLRAYMKPAPKTGTAPAWWKALQQRARTLAKAVKQACRSLFNAEVTGARVERAEKN